MNDDWIGQTAAAVVGVHLIVVAAVGALLVYLVSRWRRRRIRAAQVLITRIALAGWLSPSSALISPEGGSDPTGAVTSPDPAPVVVPHRVHIEIGGPGRHRKAA